MLKIAINGFGRIGRHAFKVAFEKKGIKIVAVNDLADNKTLAHLLKHDTAYPEYDHEVSYDDKHIVVGKKKIKAFSERDPSKLPWKKLGIDIVIESTGVFNTKEKASAHIEAGAKKVVISAHAKGEGVRGFVRGVNCKSYKNEKIIDTASCTTNCTAPVMYVLQKEFGIKKAVLTTIHSYTANQNLQDGPHKDLRRARAAGQNMIPTTTGAALATTDVVPELKGKFDGIAVRVPTITVSISDFTLVTKKKVTVEQVNKALIKASKTYMKDVLGVTNEPLVSSDFIEDPHSSIVDLGFTKVIDGDLVQIIAWYDNEWGYANRLIEMAVIAGNKK